MIQFGRVKEENQQWWLSVVKTHGWGCMETLYNPGEPASNPVSRDSASVQRLSDWAEFDKYQ